jgi:hypothetical protein
MRGVSASIENRAIYAVLAGLLVAVLCGCGGAPPRPAASERERYTAAYNQVMTAYRDRMVKLASRPLPKLPPTATGAERRAAVAAQIEEIAAATREFTARLEKLEPPAELAEVHSATQGFLQVSAEGNERWAAVIRAGDRKGTDIVLREAEAAQRDAVRRWKKAAEAAGERVPALDQLLAELEGAGQR